MANVIATLTVTFEDGTELEVEARPKDIARAEMGGWDFEKGGTVAGTYATAWAALQRAQRAGNVPDGIEVPDTIEAFLDACDVTVVGDAAGEDDSSDPALTSG